MERTDHYPQCPLHEDYELDEQDMKKVDPSELLDMVRAADNVTAINHLSVAHLRKALKPFAYLLDCRCDEIEESYREKAAEDRAERQDR